MQGIGASQSIKIFIPIFNKQIVNIKTYLLPYKINIQSVDILFHDVPEEAIFHYLEVEFLISSS